MLTASLALAALAVLAAAVVYGTDMFAAVVLRPALAMLDDSALTQATGRIHQYADRRMPLPGATSILAAAASALAAGHRRPPRSGLAHWRRARRAAGLARALHPHRGAHQPRADPRGRDPRDTPERTCAAAAVGQHHRSARRAADRSSRPARQRARRDMTTSSPQSTTPPPAPRQRAGTLTFKEPP